MTLRRQRPEEGHQEGDQPEQAEHHAAGAEPGPGEEWPGTGDEDTFRSLGALRLVEPESPAPSPSLTSAGEYVVSVLAAADEAAEKLRLDAEEEARLTRQLLEEEADDLHARLVAETEAAEARANELQANAEETAARIVGEAEERAAEIEHVAADRHRVLLSDIASSESRMTNLAETLHRVATQLEEVAAARLPLKGTDANSPLEAEADAIAR